jgi:hypothetical protein
MRSRTTGAALAAVLALGTLAGCGMPSSPVPAVPPVTATVPSTAAPASSTPAAAPASPRSAPAAAGLARFADEGTVTYSASLAPGQCHARDGGRLPDRACTPGSVDPAVTQAAIGATICRAGWTRTVRPPESETEHAKYDVAYPAYSIPAGSVSELDHLVPLELGGSDDISNLWPEAGSIPNPKDAVERELNRAVCSGTMTLAAAQRAISADWLTAGR